MKLLLLCKQITVYLQAPAIGVKIKLINHRILRSLNFCLLQSKLFRTYVFINSNMAHRKTVVEKREIQSVGGFIYNVHFFYITKEKEGE